MTTTISVMAVLSHCIFQRTAVAPVTRPLQVAWVEAHRPSSYRGVLLRLPPAEAHYGSLQGYLMGV